MPAPYCGGFATFVAELVPIASIVVLVIVVRRDYRMHPAMTRPPLSAPWNRT
jgi:hypothetical protein